MSQDTMNMAEAAEYLKLGYMATKELFDTGMLPGVSLNQKHTVFLRADLDGWIREMSRRQAAERREGAKPTERATAQTARQRRGSKPDLSRYEAWATAPTAEPTGQGGAKG